MTNRLPTRVGTVVLKNPLICGSGEHTMTSAGIRAALAAGAGAVVAKSVNESEAAKAQLDKTDYALIDPQGAQLSWGQADGDTSLFCRSGLIQRSFDDWMAELQTLDAEAAACGSYVVPSLILSDLDQCVSYASRIEQMGFRILEVNIGAPHGEEAARGAIQLERNVERIEHITRSVRAATTLPLWIKLTGQSEDVTGMADAARRGGADAVILMGRHMGFLPDLDTQRPLLNTSAAWGGAWALPLTARWLALSRKQLGRDFPLLATNGARNGLDIARFLLAGASAVEMTSAIFTQGYGVINESLSQLEAYLAEHNQNAEEVIGLAADALQAYGDQPSRPNIWQSFAPATN